MAKNNKDKLFVGVDVGGTKVLAALVTGDGRVLERERISTPREKNPALVVEVILDTVRDVISAHGVKPSAVAGVGMAIPGVVDPPAGRIVNTANMNLGGMEIVPLAAKKLGLPVFLGNDVNLGTLGEKWLGTAMDANSVVGIFVGTGIGGGVIIDGRLVTGSRQSAGEVGHMIMQIGGPKCGCGARGCFEAIASRGAIDRDIRAAVKGGRKSIIEGWADLAKLNEPIRSGAIRKALAKGDPVVTEVLARAAEVIGWACISVRHLVDPDVILLGGGVIEACGGFILPIIEKIVQSDPLTGAASPGGRVLESALGDDAVVLGAVALAQQQIGLDPFARVRRVRYPKLAWSDGRLSVSGRPCKGNCLIRADGTAISGEQFDEKLASDIDKGRLGDKSVRQLCQHRPHVVFVAQTALEPIKLTNRAQQTLHFRDVRLEILPAAEAVKAFANSDGQEHQRNAFLLAAPQPDDPKTGKGKDKDNGKKDEDDDD
jgi:glucokinase